MTKFADLKVGDWVIAWGPSAQSTGGVVKVVNDDCVTIVVGHWQQYDRTLDPSVWRFSVRER